MYFADCRAKLVESLGSGVSSIGLITSDIWFENAKEDYLSVVAHYISYDWQLEKRIIGLMLIDVSHSGEDIAERLLAMLEEYVVVNKVFSITLDNTFANTNAMERLTP